MATVTKKKPASGKARKTGGKKLHVLPALKDRKKRVGPSRREQQRLLALKIGHENRGVIQADELREACRKAGLLEGSGIANFTQDMKKDAALFAVSKTKKRGKHDSVVTWKLTDVGRKAAKEAAKVGGTVTKTFVKPVAKAAAN